MFHCLQSLETIKSDWSVLFEMYPFFDIYKNYLQIDIMASDDHNLPRWKGWVESHLRQLTYDSFKLYLCLILYLYICKLYICLVLFLNSLAFRFLHWCSWPWTSPP